jgi:tetratricopeptide (TPR) repeat protein
VMSIAGRWPQAFAHLDEVDRLGSKELRCTAELQRAAICRDVGQVDEALRLFARAIPRLRRESRWIDLARVLANRGNIRAGGGQLAAAIADYEEAEQLYLRVGQEFSALQARHDLACSLANMGDLPRALQLFDEVTARFVELRHDASVPILSRAEALLLGGLSADALTFSQEAARRLRAEGNHSAAAQALVAVAEAGRLEGDYTTAVTAARRAHEWFASNQSAGWQRAAQLEVLRSQFDGDGLAASAIDELEQMAEDLSHAGDVRSEIHARCLAALAACGHGQLERAGRQAAVASGMARRTRLLQTRLAGHHAVATVRLAGGDLTGARRELRHALDSLDSARHLRGAGDAGTAVLTQARSITALTGHIATLETQPMRALAWMERARLAGSVSHPASPLVDDDAAAGFSRLRTVASDLRRAELSGAPTAELRRRHAELEQSMRAEWLKRAQPTNAIDRLPRLSDLKKMLGDVQIISISSAGDRFVAVTVDRKRARSQVLGDPAEIGKMAQRADAALRGLAKSGDAPSVVVARQRAFTTAVAALDAALLADNRIEAAHVILVVPAELHALPWGAMPSLIGRSFALAPSVSWWLDRAHQGSAPPSSALVVAGPGLAEAKSEATRVAACYRTATLLTGPRASVAGVAGAMKHHDIVHFVAHGRFRHDNPLWSTIELADGQLTVYEIERLGAVPPTVILASCESGISGTRAGAQLHGLAGSLLSMGARTIVAAIAALPDTADTRDTMVQLHRDLGGGVSASASLARQREARNGRFSMTAAGLVTLGVG